MGKIKSNVGIRLNGYQKEKIQKYIDKEKFSTVSDFITTAVDRLIQDLEAERVEISEKRQEV